MKRGSPSRGSDGWGSTRGLLPLRSVGLVGADRAAWAMIRLDSCRAADRAVSP
jgi:hypothetical protein